MKVTYAKLAIKAIERLDVRTKKRIRQGVLRIPEGNIKRLKGHTALYRLRIGDWRILFSYPDSDTVLVERISPRGEAYKGV